MTSETPKQQSRKRRLARIAIVWIGLVLLAALLTTWWVRSQLIGSLALLDGTQPLAGLAAEVRVSRDAAGVPTLSGDSREDLARALGFIHAQERFFQMDLLRRQSAGELAELFGAFAFASDRVQRVHRFREFARSYVTSRSGEEIDVILAYTAGVNAGLNALRTAPPEYHAMRLSPQPWAAEDSILVSMSMYIDLQGGTGRRESARGLVHDLLPQALAAFLTPPGTSWDAPIVGQPFADVPVPGPEVFQLSEAAAAVASRSNTPAAQEFWHDADALTPGSNNWAVSGEHTVDGGALLANDMHLGLNVPNIWFRARMVWPDPSAASQQHDVTGVTIPGSPWIAAGSNAHLAWGYTNSQGDWIDLVILEIDPDDPMRYRTPDGWRAFERFEETLRAKDGSTEQLEVLWTIWGPVVDRDHLDRPRALRWVAHDPSPIGLGAMERAADLSEAIAVAQRAGIPSQNVLIATKDGRIGWTLMGPIPDRFGFDGALPSSWADGSRGWRGRLAPELYPQVIDPQSGRLWTANNRVVDGEMLRRLGDGGYALGARAAQIRDGLFALDQATPNDLLALQLDDRALFLERWREFLLEVLEQSSADQSRHAELRQIVMNNWTGRASPDSTAYRFVRAFRLYLARQAFGALTAACTEADSRFNFLGIGQWEGPLWQLAQQQPPHLLDPQYESWQDQFVSAVDAAIAAIAPDADTDLEPLTWGVRNRLRMQHPISMGIPQLERWLDMPDAQLPGDSHMPRVQTPRFGASQRMVLAPGRPQSSLFHMPGGQSGHPLSDYYRAGHEDWVHGRPTPLLPGDTKHELKLQPE